MYVANLYCYTCHFNTLNTVDDSIVYLFRLINCYRFFELTGTNIHYIIYHYEKVMQANRCCSIFHYLTLISVPSTPDLRL